MHEPIRHPRPRARGAALFLGLVGLTVAGCSYAPFSWFTAGAPELLPPAWDSVSPPPIVAGFEPVEPEPIEMGVPPSLSERGRNLDVLHYDIELVLPPENDRVSSRTSLRYLRDRVGPHLLTLDFTGLAVELVTARGETLDFSHENGTLRIDHPGRPGVYDTIQVEIMARGVPDDGLILRENVHGEPAAFADNWPNRARFWFPSNDHPSDKATVTFTVHAPAGRQVVANGTLVSGPSPADPERTAGIEGLESWRWENSVPIPTYLMVVGVADLQPIDLGVAACGNAPASPGPDGCIALSGWALASDIDHAASVFRRSSQMVDLYAALFGPYPFEKLAQVQSSTRFGGMENASVIFYSDQAIAQGRDIEGTVAHEIVHQWFGNSVTPADWPHLWLSEGFASYFGPLFWEQVESDAAFRDRLAGLRDRYLASGVTDRPVVDTGVTNLLDLLNANSYEKGGLVLHMLRWVMGDRAFFGGVQAYYRRHAGGNVVTSNFQEAMEETHGQSLGWFFQQWLDRPGYPQYATEWSWDAAARSARVTVIQTQSLDWPTFRMPVEFEFQMEGGVHRATHWVEGREWSATIPLAEPPSEMRVDPDGWILLREDRRSGP